MKRVFWRVALVGVGLWFGWQAGAWVTAAPTEPPSTDAPQTDQIESARNDFTDPTDADEFPDTHHPDRFFLYGVLILMFAMFIAVIARRRRE